MNYTNNDKQEFQRKEQWIAFENMFRTLCDYYKTNSEITLKIITQQAKDMVDWMGSQWPMQEIKDEPFGDKMLPRNPVKGSVKLCPVCEKPMLHITEKRNAKAPDWKCQDKDCKFQWDKGTQTYIPSDFITGVWN